ncbi:MAG: double-strand break repair protein AddB, partial [Pseudomonadota bacterium]
MVESTSHSNIFTIPNGTPFLETLYKALVDGALISGFDPTDPMAWSDLTILVPTRRAGRALRDLILMESAAEAVLLPRIRPIGDVDDDLDGLDVEDAEPDSPPAVPEFDRQLALAKLVLKWARTIDDADGPSGPVRIPASAADAAWLARDLATLMDQMATEEVSWEGLASLVPEDHAAYWQLSLGFLSIATELWPAYLTERGFLGRAERRSLLIDREARRLAAGKGGRPVIAAGSTGSIPATARLLANVAQLERGAVVLPGLPVSMDEAAWQAVLETKSGQSAPSHPLYAMKHLIAAMGANRSTIRPLGPSPDPATDTKRQAILEVFRPADVTDGWMDTIQTIRQADLTSITLVEAPGDREEATSIALALREFVEAEAGRAALITPDRNLAKRVTASLRRWAIDVDDSAGEPIMTTPAGALFRLVAEVALSGLEPVALMALTKHPLARFSEMPGQIRYAARMLELGVLRGPRPAAGLKGLAAATGTRGSGETAIGTRRAKRSQIDETAWGKVDTLVERLTTALGPLDSIRERDAPTSFAELLKHHIAALREVVADPETGERGFFDRPDGSALLTGLAGLLSAAETDFDLRPAEYVDFLESLLAGLVVRPVRPADPRVQILSPLEARLQSPDFTILSGLNEGVWPALPETDPWLSRPMRSDLGLPPPERRIGQSAHDFMQGLAGNRVLLTRSEKSDGAPTVPSRWLQRLRPVVGTENHAAMKERGKRYGDWTTRLDEPTHPTR